MTDVQQAVPVAQEQETALATAFYLLDTLAGEGLSQACDDGRTIEADDTVHALCSAFCMEPNIGWYRDLAAELAPLPLPCKSGEGADAGWIVGSADGKRFRTWMDGWSEWTDVSEAATRYARRQDAEAVHMHDEDAWTVVPYTPDATQTREAEFRSTGQFLLDRLVDHEVRMTSDEDANEWHGHVTPAMARFRAALNARGGA